MSDLVKQFGQIDIYLFDQLLRGRITPGDTLFDAGCGYGRNLVYLMRAGYRVFGVDQDPDAIAEVRRLAARHAPRLPASNFRMEPLEALSFTKGCADVVISSAVLHFARDDGQFTAMLDGSWRMLREGGVFFARLASSTGMESRMQRLGGRRYRIPDGTDRYLVDEQLLTETTSRLGGQLLDPIKTTVVQNQRCMSTWVVRKNASHDGKIAG